jgi:hypothetical protein
MLLASKAEDPGQGSSYWFCMAAQGGVYGDLLCSRSQAGVSFVPRSSIRFLGLLFLTLRHESTLVDGVSHSGLFVRG